MSAARLCEHCMAEEGLEQFQAASAVEKLDTCFLNAMLSLDWFSEVAFMRCSVLIGSQKFPLCFAQF